MTSPGSPWLSDDQMLDLMQEYASDDYDASYVELCKDCGANLTQDEPHELSCAELEESVGAGCTWSGCGHCGRCT